MRRERKKVLVVTAFAVAVLITALYAPVSPVWGAEKTAVSRVSLVIDSNVGIVYDGGYASRARPAHGVYHDEQLHEPFDRLPRIAFVVLALEDVIRIFQRGGGGHAQISPSVASPQDTACFIRLGPLAAYGIDQDVGIEEQVVIVVSMHTAPQSCREDLPSSWF